MPQIELHGKTFEVDEDSFLQEPDKWSEDVARALAELEGVTELTEKHWTIINYLRNFVNLFSFYIHNLNLTNHNRFNRVTFKPTPFSYKSCRITCCGCLVDACIKQGLAGIHNALHCWSFDWFCHCWHRP